MKIHDGKVYGYRPSDGMVLRLDNPSSAKAKTLESLTDGKQQTVESFTVIGSTPVIATGKTVIFKGGRVDVDTTGTLTLQEPPTDDIQSDCGARHPPERPLRYPVEVRKQANFIANGGKANCYDRYRPRAACTRLGARRPATTFAPAPRRSVKA